LKKFLEKARVLELMAKSLVSLYEEPEKPGENPFKNTVGLLDLLTKSLVSLYEEPEKPGDAVNYLKKTVGGTDNDKQEIEKLQTKIEDAKRLGHLQECLCCYSDDCLPEDMISCKGGHVYCRECIARGTDLAIRDGKTVIECLGHCKEEIGWQELQKVVAPNVLSKLLQRRQAEEVGAAEMDNMVSCPFCPYVTIMDNPDDKVLVCRNPECGRDSCRLCQEPNHVPLRCNEVEKQDQEEERKKIEERLSEAMMRECWKCKVKYFKEEGCNKMTCPRPGCGAKMCYLCKAQVTDYTHFYGQGGAPDKKRTCPLWTDNKKLHEQEVPAPPPVQPLPQRHLQGMPPAAGVQREQHHVARQQLPAQDHFARYQNMRQRQLTEAQRERERRNRDEAMMRLRRNRDEVLRRQRRFREHGEGRPSKPSPSCTMMIFNY